MLDQHLVEGEVTGCFLCNSKHVPVLSLPCIQKFIGSPSFFPVFASQQRVGDVISYVIPTVSCIIFSVSTLGTRSKNMLVVTTVGQKFHSLAFYFILFWGAGDGTQGLGNVRTLSPRVSYPALHLGFKQWKSFRFKWEYNVKPVSFLKWWNPKWKTW